MLWEQKRKLYLVWQNWVAGDDAVGDWLQVAAGCWLEVGMGEIVAGGV